MSALGKRRRKSRRLRIALICTEMLPVPAVRGGAIEIYLENVAPRLAKRHRVTVFCVRDRRLKKVTRRNGVRYVRLPGKKRRQTFLRALKRAIRRFGPFDVLQVFNRPRFVAPLRRAAPRARIVLSLHNEMFSRRKLGLLEARRAVRRCSAIVTVSRFLARTVTRRVPSARRKIRVVYSGADVDEFKPAYEIPEEKKEKLKRKLGIEGKRVVLAVGRLSPKKGIHVIVRAMRRVAKRRKDVALVVVGSSWFGTNEKTPFVRKLQRLSKPLKKRHQVAFTGFVKPKHLPDYYGIADVFVCGSQWREPLARVHYEAMAAGLPIITTKRGGNPEVVKGKGCGYVLRRYKSPKAMARLILRLLKNPKKAEKMGRKARRLAEKRYNWDRVCADLLKVYRKVRRRRPAGLFLLRGRWARRWRGRRRLLAGRRIRGRAFRRLGLRRRGRVRRRLRRRGRRRR